MPPISPWAKPLCAKSHWTADQILHATHCLFEGADRVLVEATSGLSVPAAASLLAACRPVRKIAGNAYSLKRLAMARALSVELSGDLDTKAVFVSGSVARGRCSADSDLDLIVLCDGRAGRIDRRIDDGITVETSFISRADLSISLGRTHGSMQDLKQASRVALALPLYDPECLHRGFVHAASQMKLSLEEQNDLASTARVAMDEILSQLRAGKNLDDRKVRSVCDIISYLCLSQSPLRYQKPKWVIDDLRTLDEKDTLDLLQWSYDLSADPQSTKAAINICEELIEKLGAIFRLPSLADTRRAGLIEDAPEYSYLCQCLTDARSLFADELYLDADYAAKFAGKMALCLLEEGKASKDAYTELEGNYRGVFSTRLQSTISDKLPLFCRLFSQTMLLTPDIAII